MGEKLLMEPEKGGSEQMIDQFIHVGVFDIEHSPFN